MNRAPTIGVVEIWDDVLETRPRTDRMIRDKFFVSFAFFPQNSAITERMFRDKFLLSIAR